eukprot:2006887-Pyramimonas_sp.AAC.2
MPALPASDWFVAQAGQTTATPSIAYSVVVTGPITLRSQDVKGYGVYVKGYSVDVKDYGVDVKGYSVDVKGYGVDVKGYGVDFNHTQVPAVGLDT